MNNNQQQILHLYNRAGFGMSFAAAQKEKNASVKKTIEKLFEEARPFHPLLEITENEIPWSQLLTMSKEEIAERFGKSRERIRELNLKWLERMSRDEGVLREKMTLFWHGHFACQSPNLFFVQQQNNLLREHALGKFGDLLTAVSKDAAMLQFLNNQQNRKNHPNENFARELMELFTLGRGNYSESDVKNAARAFTGWGFDDGGRFVFRQRQHDSGSKSFMGKTGNFTGDDILKMLLENKQCAFFVTYKICKYFVNPQPDPERVQELADHFYSSGYDIAALIKKIFLSDWFYEPHNIGVRIKSPVELLLGLQKQLEIEFEEKESFLFLQKVLGQVLFFPPNVAGWQEGHSWIDSSTLMVRLLLPEVLYKNIEVNIQGKEEGDVNTQFLARRNFKNLRAEVSCKAMTEAFAATRVGKIVEELCRYLVAVPVSETNKQLLIKRITGTTQEEAIKSIAVAITTLPEYQLC